MALPSALDRAATFVLRYGLVLIVLWFGLFKFTPTEAMAIKGLLDNSPFFSWVYSVLSVRAVSNLTGSVEILIAVLIALRPVSARLSYLGSLGAIVMFATTLSFLPRRAFLRSWMGSGYPATWAASSSRILCCWAGPSTPPPKLAAPAKR